LNLEVQRKYKRHNPYWVDPTNIEKARARRFDRVAKARLVKALARKAETEAELKRLKMPLED
jgi:hypothetical protein